MEPMSAGNISNMANLGSKPIMKDNTRHYQ